jgi:hypothetical protein
LLKTTLFTLQQYFTMHFSSGLSLAILGTAATLSCGFALNPNRVNTFSSTHRKDTSSFVPSSYVSLKTVESLELVNTISRGGARLATSSTNETDGTKSSILNTMASLWGAGGVVYILAKSIRRILPIALEPFGDESVPLTPFQLAAYVSMCLWFAYVEGYKGFQLKFSPLVVARAQTLKPFNGSPIHHILFAPFYSMGLFHATKKRKIVSWSVSIGVGIIVAAVKRLPYPWRNIVDAGVIVGLSWGSLSIMIGWMKAAIIGKDTKMDPALP